MTKSYRGLVEVSRSPWPALKADLLYIDLKAYDIAGFWKGVRLTPFIKSS